MAFSDPEQNIKQFGLHDGDVVADIGAGGGAYSIAAARAVGGSGRVYAVEVQKDFLQHIKDAAERQGVTNIEVVWGDAERNGKTKIRDRIVDAVIIANVLFQAEDKSGMVEEVKRILKPGGRVLVIDWSESFGGMGPRAEDVVARGEAQSVFEGHGFSMLGNIDAGDHHWGFIVKK